MFEIALLIAMSFVVGLLIGLSINLAIGCIFSALNNLSITVEDSQYWQSKIIVKPEGKQITDET